MESLSEFFLQLQQAAANQGSLEIKSTSSGTANELLQRTDNGVQNALTGKLSWGSTGISNRHGFCQHATRLDDKSHLSHSSNSSDFTIS